MARQGIPGVQDSVMPPELDVRPTEVVEYGAPETAVFEPNAAGTLGHASIPERQLWDVGLDPYRRLGGDPAGTALRAGQALVNALVQDHSVNQVPTTQVLEREGGSEVIYHEPGRDDQSVNIGGIEVSNNVEELAELARNMHTQEHQRSPIGLADSRLLVARLAQSMAGSVRDSFMNVLRNLGQEGAESLTSEPLPGIVQAHEYTTDSGVVMSSDRAESPLMEAMAIASQEQNANAAKPAALYHPAESNYSSPDGQFRGLGALPTLTSALPAIGVEPSVAVPPLTTAVAPVTTQISDSVMTAKWQWRQTSFEEYYSVQRQIRSAADLRYAMASATIPGTGLTVKALINQGLAVYSRNVAIPDDANHGRYYLELKTTPSVVYRWTAIEKTPSVSVIGETDDGTTQSTTLYTPTPSPVESLSDMVLASDSDMGEKEQIITAISTTEKEDGGITSMSADQTFSELGEGVTTMEVTEAAAGVVSEPVSTPAASTLGIGDATAAPIIAPVTSVMPVTQMPVAPVIPVPIAPVTSLPAVPLAPLVPTVPSTMDTYQQKTIPFTPPPVTPPGVEEDPGMYPPTPGTASEDTCSMVDAQGNIYYVNCSEVPELQNQGLEVYVGKPTNWKLIGGVALGAAAVLGVAVFAMRK